MICEENPDLEVNFKDCCFAASSINFERAATFPHHDFMNLLFGQSGVFCCGDFDYTKGGHIVLWDLKLVIRSPPGSTVLLPSALLRHSNLPIRPGEKRYSLIQYSSGHLFRYVYNGYRTNETFEATATKAEKEKRLRDEEERWEETLKSFGTVDDLISTLSHRNLAG